MMAKLSKATKGVINLDRNQNHQINSNNKNEQKKEKKNHKIALTTLQKLYSRITVKNQPVMCNIINPENYNSVNSKPIQDYPALSNYISALKSLDFPTLEFVQMYWHSKGSVNNRIKVEQYLCEVDAHVVQQGYYFLHFAKCSNTKCCTPTKPHDIKIFLQDFQGQIPALYPDSNRPGHYLILKDRMKLKNLQFHWDTYLPSFTQAETKNVCECQKNCLTAKALKWHKQYSCSLISAQIIEKNKKKQTLLENQDDPNNYTIQQKIFVTDNFGKTCSESKTFKAIENLACNSVLNDKESDVLSSRTFKRKAYIITSKIPLVSKKRKIGASTQ